jgi:hypothetical protein
MATLRAYLAEFSEIQRNGTRRAGCADIGDNG